MVRYTLVLLLVWIRSHNQFSSEPDHVSFFPFGERRTACRARNMSVCAVRQWRRDLR